ncbi:MAG: Fe-S cluster assembly protein SufD [Planctomycetes bacterium]|nr:Fe-S cluster assembly protein SufD [Planctomycetota bacterium]
MTETTINPQPTVAPYLALFESLAAAGEEPAWIAARRRSAIARLGELGFPTSRDEAWKYTRIAPIVEAAWELPEWAPNPEQLDLERFVAWEDGAWRLAFVDGVFVPEFSRVDDLPEGTLLAPRSELLAEEPQLLEELEGRHVEYAADGFKLLNAAFAGDGAFLRVPRGQRLERPVHLLFVHSGQQPVMTSPRNLIEIEDGGAATVVERYVGLGAGRYFVNSQTEVYVGRNADFVHDRIQRDDDTAFHIGNLELHLDRDARCSSTAISVGALIGRHEVRQVQGGPGTTCRLNGLFVVDGDRVSDNVVVVDHSQDQGHSEQLYKGILDDRALGIFNGSIIAEEGTRGTEAHQTNKNLLLSDTAVAETRPQLEIYTDEIACSHGATVGQLDGEQLFYLRSRGIAADQARAMLTHAFAADVIDRVGSAATRRRIEDHLAERVAWGRVAITEES